MLPNFLMFFFSFNPIICGLVFASGALMVARHTPSQSETAINLTNITVLRRLRAAGGEARQANHR